MKKLILSLIAALVFISFIPIIFAQSCHTIVTVSVSPSSIYAGDCITISGRVYASYPCRRPDPPVQLYLDNSYIATANTDAQGYYSYIYTTSTSLSSGSHTIKAVSRIDCCAEGYATTTFTVSARCEAKYLDVWQCSGNWRERQYQNADCSLVWQKYEYCDYGCSAGQCISAPPCVRPCEPCHEPCREPCYYPYYCPYVQTPCSISVSVTTPNDLFLGETIYSTVSVSNSGDVGGSVNVDAYVCRADGYNCQAMSCDGYDPYVYVPGHSTRTLSCSNTANELSLHKIKVNYYGCGVDPTIYSAVFDVKSYPACAAGYLNNFQCVGNWKQQLYQFSDCRTEWRNVLFCDYGCSAGQCSEAPKQGTPEIFAEEEYTVKKCERNKFTFEISNTGEATDVFDISFSGSAARWIKSISSISLAAGQTRTINAYATVPCSAEGEYDLTISATDGKKTSVTTVLAVAEERFLLPITGWVAEWPTFFRIAFYALLFLVVVGVVFILLLLFVWGLPKKRGQQQPESFRQSISFVRKKPESFAERECYHR